MKQELFHYGHTTHRNGKINSALILVLVLVSTSILLGSLLCSSLISWLLFLLLVLGGVLIMKYLVNPFFIVATITIISIVSLSWYVGPTRVYFLDVACPFFITLWFVRTCAEKKIIISKSVLTILTLAYLLVNLFAFLRNPSFITPGTGVSSFRPAYSVIISFSVYWIVFYFLRTEKEIYNLVKIIIGICYFVMFSSFLIVIFKIRVPIIQSILGLSYLSWPSRIPIRIGALGKVSFLSLTLLLVFRQNFFNNKLYFCLFFLAIIGLLLSGGRTSIGMAVISLLLFLFLKKKYNLIAFLGGVIIFLWILFPYSNVSYSPQLARVLSIKPSVESEPGQSTFWRLGMWRIALNIIREHPIAGIGYGQFEMISGKSISKSFPGEYRINLTRFVTQGTAHNAYLSIAVGTGLIGVFIFVCILFVAFKYSLNLFKSSPSPFLKSIGMWLFLYLGARVLGFLFEGGSWNIQLFLFLGILEASVRLAKRQQKLERNGC